MSDKDQSASEFDAFAEDYDTALAQGLSVSGEDKNYFAQGRIDWLARCLRMHQCDPRRVLDFGCGTGSSAPFLLKLPEIQELVGVDVSAKSIEVARRLHESDRVKFHSSTEFAPQADMDLAFCNGVFHHIPLDRRRQAIEKVWAALRPGGLFAFWENNPWNPGTRYVMSRIPFDRDAVTLSARTAGKLLAEGRFEIIRSDFLFYFPRFLSWLRPAEALLRTLPLGAQYQLLARKRA
jgi:SAM-dependent methyltransferase